jgi:hypothetical protein
MTYDRFSAAPTGASNAASAVTAMSLRIRLLVAGRGLHRGLHGEANPVTSSMYDLRSQAVFGSTMRMKMDPPGFKHKDTDMSPNAATIQAPRTVRRPLWLVARSDGSRAPLPGYRHVSHETSVSPGRRALLARGRAQGSAAALWWGLVERRTTPPCGCRR